jgi:hypothetical protein
MKHILSSIHPSNGPAPHKGALASSSRGSVTAAFYGVRLLFPRLTPNLEDQVSVFMTPEDRVAQLYPRALGSLGVPLPVPTVVGPWGEYPISFYDFLV